MICGLQKFPGNFNSPYTFNTTAPGQQNIILWPLKHLLGVTGVTQCSLPRPSSLPSNGRNSNFLLYWLSLDVSTTAVFHRLPPNYYSPHLSSSVLSSTSWGINSQLTHRPLLPPNYCLPHLSSSVPSSTFWGTFTSTLSSPTGHCHPSQSPMGTPTSPVTTTNIPLPLSVPVPRGLCFVWAVENTLPLPGACLSNGAGPAGFLWLKALSLGPEQRVPGEEAKS